MINKEYYSEADIQWISDVKKENIGNLIKTQGIITSTDNVNPVLIEKAYICKACQKIHKITEKDSHENPEKCIKCTGSLIPTDHGLYDDTQLMTIQDIFDTNRTEIYASTLGDEAYYGKYNTGDYVDIIARVDTTKLNNRYKLILKIDEIKKVDITINMDIGKKFWKSKQTEAQNARASTQYKQWRKDVLERDGYTCQKCNKYPEFISELDVHHIYSFSGHPYHRYEVENGITLCKEHHQLFHRIYRNHGRYELNEFLRLKQYIES